MINATQLRHFPVPETLYSTCLSVIQSVENALLKDVLGKVECVFLKANCRMAASKHVFWNVTGQIED